MFKNTSKFSSIEAYTRHGGPYDRGSADKYYGRSAVPHYFKGATHQSDLVSYENMTLEEIEAYYAGYEEETDRKDFGGSIYD